MERDVLDTIKGKRFADVVVKNGSFINVASGEVYDGGVAITGKYVVGIDNLDSYIGPKTKIIDAEGKYITPGFIDGHIHPESSNLSIKRFAEAILKHGTTTIMTDIHEIGVVSDLEGIEAVLDEGKQTDLNIYFVVPSHIPFAPNLETSKGQFNSEKIKKALERDDAVGLSEVVSAYLTAGFPDLEKSMAQTLKNRQTCQGHMPETTGRDLDYCIASGVTTNHECLSTEESLEHVRKGCHLMMREGSAARSLNDSVKVITEYNCDSTMCSIVTDDLHTIDLVDRGDLDNALRSAVKAGVDIVTAIQLVTINAARAFHLEREVGALIPGARGDVLLLDKDSLEVVQTIAGGEVVYIKDEFEVKYKDTVHASCLLNTVKLPKFKKEDLAIHVDKSATSVDVLGMRTLDWIPITIPQKGTLAVKDGIIQCDVEQDLLYIAQMERYGINGNIGKGFIAGFNLKSGAIASSIAHDNHNVIVIGTNLEDMEIAFNHIQEINGGQCVVDKGEVLSSVAFPICGLMSDLSAEELATAKKVMIAKTHELGSKIPIPFMFLSFIGLAAIPSFAITDKGFIDVEKQKIIDPVLEVR